MSAHHHLSPFDAASVNDAFQKPTGSYQVKKRSGGKRPLSPFPRLWVAPRLQKFV